MSSEKILIEPFDHFVLRSSYKHKRSLEKTKIACAILAGGQGTRLGWQGPKALFPILPEKTLLQIHLEKIKKADIPVAIMCSPLNIDSIRTSLEASNYFGLQSVDLFVQDMLPLLDQEKQVFFEAPGDICMGPDGNGYVFRYLEHAGILQRWKKSGIEHIAVLPIDNPLACPLDPALIDFHIEQGCDVTTACVLREDPYENVGAFAKSSGRPCVLEYSEIKPELRTARKADGSLVLPLANINIFLFRFAFAEQLAEREFPWHAAEKKARRYDPAQQTTEEISAWKLETFLFDALPWANDMAALVYPREEMYAPLKNATGDRSPETVRAALQKSLLCYDQGEMQHG